MWRAALAPSEAPDYAHSSPTLPLLLGWDGASEGPAFLCLRHYGPSRLGSRTPPHGTPVFHMRLSTHCSRDQAWLAQKTPP